MILPDGRDVSLGSVFAPLCFSNTCPFATLLPAFDEQERRQAVRLVDDLLRLGCKDFCCAGPQAEQLHDSIDAVVEKRGELDVVTTWHKDCTDACEYFLYATVGKGLLALIEEHPELEASLSDVAR